MNMIVSILLVLSWSDEPRTRTETAKGTLLLVGGGKTADSLVRDALKLAGGDEARVLLVPQASARGEAGDSSKKHWLEHGARHVDVLDVADRDAACTAIGKADLIWMPGGDQSRLVAALREADLIEAVRERYRSGAVVGGTSAGAAAASGVMLTGGADLTKVLADSTPTAPGLDLWPEVIVDQHFVARNRFNRLLAAVLDQPQLVGVGLDEGTGVIVRGREFEVIGAGQVVVIDARTADTPRAATSQPHTTRDATLHVLRAGMKFDLGAQRRSPVADAPAPARSPQESGTVDKKHGE
jgi:cyanophycinase